MTFQIKRKRVVVSQKIDIDQVKANISIFGKLCQRKTAYLIECINRFAFQGAFWWLKTHSQNDELKRINSRLTDLL
jgi:hypothetical protein